MSKLNLQLVREHETYLFYTEDPKHIHPEYLSLWLKDKYGKSNVKAYFVEEIYLIYVRRSPTNTSEMTSIPGDNSSNPSGNPDENAPVGWEQIGFSLEDLAAARKVYEESALS
ncbi:hypothetical protein GGR51DRAFT_526071 [Nemania sp. FL0031]|nr:hypothetical protein GGR51DRAFT_526071 [Nemania sp. FL0031]